MNDHKVMISNESIVNNDMVTHQTKRYDKLAKKEIKGEVCFVCGKEVSSFCNSHTIPAFMLRYISSNGHLKSFGDLVPNPLDKGIKGVKQSGTFQLICRDCDSKLFKNYENENNYRNINAIKELLGEIALKITLKTISKRVYEKRMYELILKDISNSPYDDFLKEMIHGKSLDLKQLKKDYQYIISNVYNVELFKILYYLKLPYRASVAVQDMINLTCDFDGNIINNIFDMSDDNILYPFYICIFPMKSESHIIIFTRKEVNLYDKFFLQLGKKTSCEQLQLINYLIIENLEDYFINEKIDTTSLKAVASRLPVIEGVEEIDSLDSISIYNQDYFSPSNWSSLYNLLDNKI